MHNYFFFCKRTKKANKLNEKPNLNYVQYKYQHDHFKNEEHLIQKETKKLNVI